MFPAPGQGEKEETIPGTKLNGNKHEETGVKLSELVTEHADENLEVAVEEAKKEEDYKASDVDEQPNVSSSSMWTEQDDLEMLLAHHKCQNRWSDVASVMEGRSNNTIKNKFYSVFRKVKHKVKKMDTRYTSPIELFAILYMLALMEIYIRLHGPTLRSGMSSSPNSRAAAQTNGKCPRSKDFLYKLLNNLSLMEVQRYEIEFTKNHPTAMSLAQLETELLASVGPKIQRLYQPPPKPLPLPQPQLKPILQPEPTYPRPLQLPLQLQPRREGGSVITDVNERCRLPVPRLEVQPEAVTPEEKSFILTQAFQRLSPCSAGTRLYAPSMLSPSAYSPALYSAGIPPIPTWGSPRVRFGDFSDFSELATRSPVRQPYAVYKPQAVRAPVPQAYSGQSFSLFNVPRERGLPFELRPVEIRGSNRTPNSCSPFQP
jgi:hypothetical protein